MVSALTPPPRAGRPASPAPSASSRSGPPARRPASRCASRRRGSVAKATQRGGDGVDVSDRDERGGGVVDLARHRRVVGDDRHAGGHRLERRQPEPFVGREPRERGGGAVKRGELVVRHPGADLDGRGEAEVAGDRERILPRERAVVADDHEPGSRVGPGQRREGTDQVGEMAAIELRADAEHERRRVVARSRDRRPDAGAHAERRHAHARRRDPEPADDFVARERRVGEHGRRVGRRELAGPAPAQALAPREPFRVRRRTTRRGSSARSGAGAKSGAE